MTTTELPPAAPTAPAAERPLPRTRRPLTIGDITVDTPVMLAPMAGVTNVAFRLLCREFGSRYSAGDGGLFPSEMVTTRALVEDHRESWRLVTMGEKETPRSVQLYGVDPATVRRSVQMLIERGIVDHIDLNFGCPVPKVTRRGGGGVLPWKSELFTRIVGAAVEAADGAVPVTVKTRIGIDAEHPTYRDAGLIAQEVGAQAVTVHGRTVDQQYSGQAAWDAIADLAGLLDIPVLGNGDIWSAEDALAMVEQTGCAGVVVGRACQGRPWLFADLAAGFAGLPDRVRPPLAEVAAILYRHGELLVDYYDGDEGRGVRDLRKHVAWYFKGYPVGGDLRHRLATADSLADLEAKLSELDPDVSYPGAPVEGPRGRAGSPRRAVVPQGWMDSRELSEEHRSRLHEAELDTSGG